MLEGADLQREVIWLREATMQLRRLSSAAPVPLLEQAAIAGALTPDTARATAAAQALVARLNAVSLPHERGWVVAVDGGLTLSRTVRGVAERHFLDPRRAAQRGGAVAGRPRRGAGREVPRTGEAEAGRAGGGGGGSGECVRPDHGARDGAG